MLAHVQLFNHTNLDQIQAMALIGHCLRNNLDTNSAWILMGATIRLAQSIGLHEASPTLPASEQFQRNLLWWTLVWQDTFLSFTYGRPQSTIAMGCPIPHPVSTANCWPLILGIYFHHLQHTSQQSAARDRWKPRRPTAERAQVQTTIRRGLERRCTTPHRQGTVHLVTCCG